MRYIVVAVLLMVTCKAPPNKTMELKAIVGEETHDVKVKNKIILKGDSNVININTYIILKEDTTKRDSL